MKTIYLNMITDYGTETVDQISRSEYPSEKEYRKELKNMLENYRLAGMAVYISQRCTKDWREK